METIDFKKTPDQLTHAADFLRGHANRVKRKGDQLLVDGARHREIKLLLHKFLRHRGLNGYRILSGSGVIEVVPPPSVKESVHEEGSPPSASATMPYFFPGSPPVKVERKVRKRRGP